MPLALHAKHLTFRGQQTECQTVHSARCPEEGSLRLLALADPGSHQGPGPSSLYPQFHGPKMDAAAPDITNPLKVSKYRAENTQPSGGFPPFNLAKKSFPAASGPFPLTSHQPEQCLFLNPSLSKSNGTALDGSPTRDSSSGIPVFTNDQPSISTNDETILLLFYHFT